MLVSIVLILSFGCDSSKGKPDLNQSKAIWNKVESEYSAMGPAEAYPLLQSAREELLQLSVSAPKALNYGSCLGVVNGRLFLVARSLGKTNEALRFLQEAERHFNEQRRKDRLPMTNFSAEGMESIMKRRDAALPK